MESNNDISEIIRLINEARSAIAALGVSRLGLFGSCVRNEMRPNSDIDVLVEFKEGARRYDNLFELGDLLEKLFCVNTGAIRASRRIDLVTLESLSPHLRPHILRDVRYVQIAD